jgi:hypothetical protein
MVNLEMLVSQEIQELQVLQEMLELQPNQAVVVEADQQEHQAFQILQRKKQFLLVL